MRLEDINIRDPFVLANDQDKTYYLYGTTAAFNGVGFYCYSSKDLKEFEGPFRVFSPSDSFWGKKDFWAPEVYCIKGKYYLLASFFALDHRRGCQLFVSDSPKGPFVDYSDLLTPPDFEALDATLCFDDSGYPYIVFCREWLQTKIGEMWRQDLSPDLKHPVGKPIYLFKGDDAKWASTKVFFSEERVCITDGPFLYKSGKRKALLWSTFVDYKNYGFGYALFDDENNVCAQSETILPVVDGGHCMVFKTFDGQDTLACHVDNRSSHERAKFIPIEFNDDGGLTIHE